MRPSRTHYYLTVATALMSTGLGGAILGGGDARFSNHGFATARELFGPSVWGLNLILAGIVLTLGIVLNRCILRSLGLAGVAAWSWFFAATLGLTAIQDDHTAFTGAFIYTWTGVVAVTLSRTDAGQIKS